MLIKEGAYQGSIRYCHEEQTKRIANLYNASQNVRHHFIHIKTAFMSPCRKEINYLQTIPSRGLSYQRYSK